MSAKAPKVLGGTTDNTGERFHVGREEEEVEQQVNLMPDLSAESIQEVTEIQSLCMNCHSEHGMTRLLLTQIPFFREVILMSFSCDECGFRNSEVQFGGTIQPKGRSMRVTIETPEDLNRQIIKADTASLVVVELDFEIPAKTQRGTINTVEGILKKAVSDLQANQEERRVIDRETTEKIDSVLARLVLMATGLELPFTLVVNDPSGNSFVENPRAPSADPRCTTTFYIRSEAQDLMCGQQPESIDTTEPRTVEEKVVNLASQESVHFPTDCFACSKMGQTQMCVTNIPHFKEVIIMAFSCDHCGYKNNEVKGSGAVPDRGEKITLVIPVNDDMPSNLDRDILKSDSAALAIPECDLELMGGSLGGVYTTVEGLLGKIITNLKEGNPFGCGDSATSSPESKQLKKLLLQLDRYRQGLEGFTLIMSDPLANSFIYSPCGSSLDDPLLSSEEYTRTFEEDEDLGLHDMHVENYEDGQEQVAVDLKKENNIQSDKHSMARGGQAIDPKAYHPNPNAILVLDEDH